jgi:hypothetical protein
LQTKSRLTNTPILATDKPPRNTAALDLLARVHCSIGIITWEGLRTTFLQGAIERFDLGGPELECARPVGTVAAEGDLRRTSREHVDDFAV